MNQREAVSTVLKMAEAYRLLCIKITKEQEEAIRFLSQTLEHGCFYDDDRICPHCNNKLNLNGTCLYCTEWVAGPVNGLNIRAITSRIQTGDCDIYDFTARTLDILANTINDILNRLKKLEKPE